MRHIILAIVALFVCSSAVAAGTVEVVSIHSNALAGNLTGDPAEQSFRIYLPASYRVSNRRYAVVFLLHGIGDTSEVWLNYFHVPELLDQLIARGTIAEMIVVMPNAKNRFWGSFYANSPVTGNWEDFIAQELVVRVDHDFRTIGTPASRAVVGHSMGGFGAIRLAMHRPDVFPVVYAMSPCCLDAIEDTGYANADAWRQFFALKSYDDADRALREGAWLGAVSLGLLSAIDPDLTAPLHVKIPVVQNGNDILPKEPAWSEYRDKFPLQQIAKYRDNLRRLRALAIDYGLQDQFAHIPPATSAFSKALNDAHVPHVLETYDGDHRQMITERLGTTVLPFISRKLEH